MIKKRILALAVLCIILITGCTTEKENFEENYTKCMKQNEILVNHLTECVELSTQLITQLMVYESKFNLTGVE